MSDHSVLVGVGDGPRFQSLHLGESLRHPRQQRREVAVGEADAAHVERESEIVIRDEILTVALPCGGHFGHPSTCAMLIGLCRNVVVRRRARETGGYDIASPLPSRASTFGENSVTPSLCETCRHVRIVTTPKGSRFLLCTLASDDVRFAKYPPQPVARCVGHEPVAPHSSREGDAPAEPQQ